MLVVRWKNVLLTSSRPLRWRFALPVIHRWIRAYHYVDWTWDRKHWLMTSEKYRKKCHPNLRTFVVLQRKRLVFSTSFSAWEWWLERILRKLMSWYLTAGELHNSMSGWCWVHYVWLCHWLRTYVVLRLSQNNAHQSVKFCSTLRFTNTFVSAFAKTSFIRMIRLKQSKRWKLNLLV